VSFWDSEVYVWVVLPLIVFLARIIDVSLGTLRIIFISRGKRNIAPLLGFVEVFIWITVVSQIVTGVNNILTYLAYAAGFAAGNYVGMWIEDRLAIGTQIVRVIVAEGSDLLAANLSAAGYGITLVDATGATGAVKLVYSIVKRKDIPAFLALVHQTHPHAFLSIEDVRSTREGIFPAAQTVGVTRWGRKSK